ncbi:MAG TPA: ELWxxDGT repeat protein, partial [Thermoanaerobaculia bacterium]|nr:ELWxxDGT repeat protein [Thermoanaerobaculia bacterium]
MFALFIAMPCVASEGVPRLLADIDPHLPSPTAQDAGRGADPRAWTALGDKALFVAYTHSGGYEPWVTDGTNAGTLQLADTCPGACGNPFQFLGAARGLAFFVTGDSPGLWRTDGTARGTFRLIDGVARPFDGVVAESGLFFIHGTYYEEDLWHSDGTVAGTRQLADLGVGLAYASSFVVAGSHVVFGTSYPHAAVWSSDGTAAGTLELMAGQAGEAVAVAGRAYLIVDTPAAGPELWSSDGTAGGTVRISNFAPGHPFSSSGALASDGDTLFVRADDGTHGPEFFRLKADGQLLRVSDTPLSGPQRFAAAGNRVVMTAYDAGATWRLWIGGPGDIAQPLLSGCIEDCPLPSPDDGLVSVGSRVVFVADGSAGREVWSTDGTVAGTRRLTDLCSGSCDSSVRILGRQLDVVFFAGGVNEGIDVGLWVTDGTPEGTRRILDLGNPVFYGTNEQFFSPDGASVGPRAFFGASDAQWGLQPWVTDGTPAGTHQITVIEPNGVSSGATDLGATASGAAFIACDGQRLRAYKTDGTANGTSAFDAPDGSCSYYWEGPRLGLARDDRYYVLTTGDASGLWSIDLATGAATQLVSLDGYGFNFTRSLRPWGPHGATFLTSNPSTFAQDLWVTDGTPAGTLQIDLPPDLVHPSDLATVGNRVYFTALESGGNALWTSDGTPAGTLRLVPGMRSAFDFVRHGNATYFAGDGAIWRTDGTVAGTAPLAAVPVPYYSAYDLATFGGLLYFFASSEQQHPRIGLWRSDGTAAGTWSVLRLPLATDGIIGPADLTATEGGLFFSSTDPEHGRELWHSDGTAAGTMLVRDLVPGIDSPAPSWLTAAPGGSLFFVAHDGVHGFELWHSDGTTAGTRMVQDIAPGPLSSRPDQLTVSGGQLFFTADDDLHGREPWVLPLAGSAACAPTETRLCLLGGRYAVEATWRDHAGRNGIGTAVRLTSDTGTFWFFGPGNLEVAIKVLDGTPLNGHRWVFYGALSDVEYTLTVTDTATGAVRRYVNPRRILASVGDTSAFGPNGAT